MLSRSVIARFAISLFAALAILPLAHAADDADEIFAELREAAKKDNASKAAELANRLKDYAIPSYVEYFRLKPAIGTVSASEINSFLSRYAGSAIADRLRNDWLLELGRKRNWLAFDRQYPQFVLKDDLQLKCYALMSAATKGQNVADEARELLTMPKKYGEGCEALVVALAKNKQFSADDVWAQIRLAGEAGKGSLAENLASAVNAPEKQIARSVDLPLLTLARGPQSSRATHETFIIALGRLARKNHEQAAEFVLKHAVEKLSTQEQALAWAHIALPAAMNLAPEAINYWRKSEGAPLSIEGHEWKVRTALRTGDWKMVKESIQAMPPSLQKDPAWVYWLGRALVAEGYKSEANRLFQSISDYYHFYGQLALEELGHKITVPPPPSPATAEEIAPMAANQGFARALKLLDMDMRIEGLREWNWELRRMSEREMLAAAEFARQNNVLDRMVYSSERTKNEVDFSQRFPSPHRNLMAAATQQLGLDMAWTYGLIRQESRFVKNAKSSAGASGLMQLMPATARYVAKKIGMNDFSQANVNDPKTNIALGTNYLKMVLNDLDGSQAMATAAYNAGPKRPRSWRSTLPRAVEGAIFAETIPFTETRGYVKNVMSNASYYAAMFENRQQSLKARLGTVSPQTYVATALP